MQPTYSDSATTFRTEIQAFLAEHLGGRAQADDGARGASSMELR